MQAAFAEARATKGKPSVLVARTLKGKGISIMEGKPGWHGKALKADEADAAVAELEAQLVPEDGGRPSRSRRRPASSPGPIPRRPAPWRRRPTRRANWSRRARRSAPALAKLGAADARVVALDADVKNSTFSDRFEKAFPERFYQAFIAEQVMVGMAMGLAARGAIPFAATFAAFLTRAADFVRMAGISQVNVKFAGSHCGVSIGEDGPSQMALEDLAMFRGVPGCAVLYPCDAVSTEKLMAAAAAHPGMAYLRTSRPKTPVIYDATDAFPVGGSKVLRSSAADVLTIVTAGVTVFEALGAADAVAADGVHVRVIDLYSVKPVDAATLLAAGRETGLLLTVEDHYSAGGIGDAVCEVVAPHGVRVERVAVPGVPRSGTPDELMDVNGLSARALTRDRPPVGQRSLTRARTADRHARGFSPRPSGRAGRPRGRRAAPRAPGAGGPPARLGPRPRVGARRAIASPSPSSTSSGRWRQTGASRECSRPGPKGTPSAVERDPAWAPDGRRIAFAADLGTGFDLYVALEGGAPRRLTIAPGDERHPVVDPGRPARVRPARRVSSGGSWSSTWTGPTRTCRRPSRWSWTTPADEQYPAVSPDGTRLAYVSSQQDDRGADDVWVRAMAGLADAARGRRAAVGPAAG